MINEFEKWLETTAKIGKRTIENCRAVIKKIFAWCVDEKLCFSGEDFYSMDIVRFYQIYCIVGERTDRFTSTERSHFNKLLGFKKYQLKTAYALKNDEKGSVAFFEVLQILKKQFKYPDTDWEKLSDIINILLYGSLIDIDIKDKNSFELLFDPWNDDSDAEFYRQIILANCRVRRDAIIKRLSSELSRQAGKVYENIYSKPVSDNGIDMYCTLVRGFADGVISKYDKCKGFEGSAIQIQLYLMRSVINDSIFFKKGNECAEYDLSEMVFDLIMLVLENQGKPFVECSHLHPTRNNDKFLVSLIAPFLRLANTAGLQRSALSDDGLLKRLIALKILYPSYDGKEIMVSKSMVYDIPVDGEGLRTVKSLWNNECELKLLRLLLAEILWGLKDKIGNGGLFNERIDVPDLFVLLIATQAKDGVETYRFINVLERIAVVCYLHNFYCESVSGREKVKIAEQLTVLLKKYPREFIDGMEEYYGIAPMNRNVVLCCDLPLSIRASLQLFIAKTTLDDAEKAYKDKKDSEYVGLLLSRSMIASREAKERAEKIKGSYMAAEACYCLAKAYCLLAEVEYSEEVAAYIDNDCILPAVKVLSAALKLADDKPLKDTITAFCKQRLPQYFVFDGEKTEISEKTKEALLHGDDLIKGVISSEKSRDALRGSRAPHILLPRELDKSTFFNAYYLADIDSETAVRKGFTAKDIEKPVLSTLLSGQSVVLTAPQLVDTNLRRLTSIPQFLQLFSTGLISVSLFGGFTSLKDFFINRLGTTFKFSSLDFLNYTGFADNEIGRCRSAIADCLRNGNYPERSMFVDMDDNRFDEICEFIESIRLLDENIRSVYRTLHFQHYNGDVNTLMQKWLEHDYDQKRARYNDQYFIHRIVDRTLRKQISEDTRREQDPKKWRKYDRSNYISVLKLIEDRRESELVFADRGEEIDYFDVLSRGRRGVIEPMYDILNNNYSIALSRSITNFTVSSYKSSEAELIPALDRDMKKKTYDDFMTVGVSGYSVDIGALMEYVTGIRSVINDSKTLSDLKTKLNSLPENREVLEYDIDDEGPNLVDATYQVSDRETIRVTKEQLTENTEKIKNLETEGK